MTKTTLTVPDISCGHCKMSIEGAVADLRGVSTVEVAVEDRTVDLTFDDATVTLDQIIDAIEDQGYEVPR